MMTRYESNHVHVEDSVMKLFLSEHSVDDFVAAFGRAIMGRVPTDEEFELDACGESGRIDLIDGETTGKMWTVYVVEVSRRVVSLRD